MDKSRKKIKNCYRYEIFVPLNYNDGRPVEPEKILRTTEELMEKSDGISQYRTSLRASGLWKEGDKVYADQMTVFRFDIEESMDLLDFFLEYKVKLKKDYEQIQIYMTRQNIELL